MIRVEGGEYWLLSPARLAQQTRRTLSRTINRRLRNRDWQERNRVYVEPMYIILTALRVHLRIVEKEDKEGTKGKGERGSVTGEKRSGYWNGEIYRNWESEAACDRRNALVTCNMQGRFMFTLWSLSDLLLSEDFFMRFATRIFLFSHNLW